MHLCRHYAVTRALSGPSIRRVLVNQLSGRDVDRLPYVRPLLHIEGVLAVVFHAPLMKLKLSETIIEVTLSSNC